ncbi:MAG: hypothetical protein J6M22_04175, partial [Firmicutes bacterium]|nr:hypothetical protein [Bacillota bacterium]
MSDFNTDFNMGAAPEPETLQAEPELEVEVLTASEEYKRYPLTTTERDQIEAFAKKIDLYDSNAIMQYASGTQKQIADFSGQ